MAAEIRSTHFYLSQLVGVAGASNLLYTVPSGSVALIYSVTLANIAGVALTDLRLQCTPAGGLNVVAWIVPSLGALASTHFSERIVLLEGDQLRLRTGSAGTVHVGVFGQLLEPLS